MSAAWKQKATHIEVDAGVRYWEDGEVNGVQDDNGTLMFGAEGGAEGGRWKVKIDLASGRIEGWPEGTTASVHYKVCDDGEYWLTDATGTRLARWVGFDVPNDFLCHGSNGYGDYIIFDIDADGVIAGYKRPEITIWRGDDERGWAALEAGQ